MTQLNLCRRRIDYCLALLTPVKLREISFYVQYRRRSFRKQRLDTLQPYKRH